MNITGKEGAELAAAILEAAPGLAEIPTGKLQQLLSIVITETTRTNHGVEKCIQDAGSIPPDITMTLMHYGALTAIYRDLPLGDSRRALVTAGELVGALIARKYGEKIQQDLAAKTPKH